MNLDVGDNLSFFFPVRVQSGAGVKSTASETVIDERLGSMPIPWEGEEGVSRADLALFVGGEIC